MRKEEENNKRELKAMLARYILSLDLFEGNERALFSPLSGGVFRCPVCKKRIALFLKDKSITDPYGINNFSHCSHFGKGGEYPSDIFGLYAAVNGLSVKESFKKLMNGEEPQLLNSERNFTFKNVVDTVAKKKSEIENSNIESITASALWGEKMSKEGKALLKKRGIGESVLKSSIGDKIGYISSLTLKGRTGRNFTTSGIVFALGSKERSYQIRRTREGEYVKKMQGDFRFFSIGEAKPFNEEAICSSSSFSPLFVTEGPFDALSFALFKVNAVATIGAANHKKILSAIREKEEKITVLLCFDKDTAGKKGSELLKKELKDAGINSLIFPSTPDNTDFNDYICSNRKSAEKRVCFAKGLGCSLSAGIINEATANRLIELLVEADSKKKSDKYCVNATEYLRALWRKNA